MDSVYQLKLSAARMDHLQLLIAATILSVVGYFISWILCASGVCFALYLLYDWYCARARLSAVESLSAEKKSKKDKEH
jgi:hypothetical protein